MVWVDVGGGTARNLEFFALHTLRRFFRKIYIVDVSRSLLEVRRILASSRRLVDLSFESLVDEDAQRTL